MTNFFIREAGSVLSVAAILAVVTVTDVTDAVLLTDENTKGACPSDGAGTPFRPVRQCGYSLNDLGDVFNRSSYKCNNASGVEEYCSFYHPKGAAGMINDLGFCCAALGAYPASYTCEAYKTCKTCIEDDENGHRSPGNIFNPFKCGWDGEHCIDTSIWPNGQPGLPNKYLFKTKLAQCDAEDDIDYYALYGDSYATYYSLRGTCASRCDVVGWANPKKNVIECRAIPNAAGTGSSGMTDQQISLYLSSLFPGAIPLTRPTGPAENTQTISELSIANQVASVLSSLPVNAIRPVTPGGLSIFGGQGMSMNYGSSMGPMGPMGSMSYMSSMAYPNFGAFGPMSSYRSASQFSSYPVSRQYGYGSPMSYGSSMYNPMSYGNPGMIGPQTSSVTSSFIQMVQQAALSGITLPDGSYASASSGGGDPSCTMPNECSCDKDCKYEGRCCSDWLTECPLIKYRT